MFRFDHVVLAVRDLDASASRLWDEHGLRFRPGGAHPQWGTANMIAPMGESYLELLAVVDPAVGPNTVLGRSLLDRSAVGDRWWSVCLGDDDLDATATRLGLNVQPGSRRRPDGVVIRWLGAGIDQRGSDLWLPFFIAWDVPPELHPGAAQADHGIDVRGISWVEVGGDRARLRAWLGGADVPIRVVDAEPGVHAVALALAGGELVL